MDSDPVMLKRPEKLKKGLPFIEMLDPVRVPEFMD
jgi:hypothetical protein